jgi:hypothetical protein
MCRFWCVLGSDALCAYQGFRLQKPRLPARTFGLHSSNVRYWQSQITLPVPTDTTAHHGPIPVARPAGVSKQSAAANTATARTNRMIFPPLRGLDELGNPKMFIKSLHVLHFNFRKSHNNSTLGTCAPPLPSRTMPIYFPFAGRHKESH